MYAAPFDYVRVGSWADGVDALVRHGEVARVIAGGQSLAPMMAMQLVVPEVLIDVGRAAPREVRRADDHVSIGALVTHGQLISSPVIAEYFPVLAEAAAVIGNVRVRSRGTIGGSLAHADPSAELPCVAVALGARVAVVGPDGGREIPASELFVSHFETSLRPGELLTDVLVPLPVSGTRTAFAEFSRRPGDYALVEAAATLAVDEDGAVSDVHLVLGAVGAVPLDVSSFCADLVGRVPHDAELRQAAESVARGAELEASGQVSMTYIRELVEVVSIRALRASSPSAMRGSEK